MNVYATTEKAENWLAAAILVLIVFAGYSFVQSAAAYYMSANYPTSPNISQAQIELDESYKSLYATHILGAGGQDACGCPYCCGA